MMFRLVREQAWRMRWILLYALFVGVASYSATRPTSARFHGAILILLASGAGSRIAAFWSREMRLLPVDRRFAFRSAWIALMAVPTALLLGRLGFYLAGLGGWVSPRPFEPLVTRTVFDALYLGTTFAFRAIDDDQWPETGWFGLLLIGQVIWFAIPFAVPELVPVRFADISWTHAIGATIMLVLAAWPVVRPRNEWPAGDSATVARQTEPVLDPKVRFPRSRFDRLLGFSRLLPSHIIGGVFISAIALLTTSAFQFAKRGAIGSPFAAGPHDIDVLMSGGLWLVLLLAPVVLGTALTPWLRQLKSVPMRTTQLTVIMTTLPLITPVIFWACGAAVQLILTGHWPDSWRWNILLAVCGLLSITHAIAIRRGGQSKRLTPVVAAPFLGLLIGLALASELGITVSSIRLHPLIGVAGLLLAYGVNHHTVTRLGSNTSTYRPAPLRRSEVGR